MIHFQALPVFCSLQPGSSLRDERAMDDGEKANERGKGWLGVLGEIKRTPKILYLKPLKVADRLA